MARARASLWLQLRLGSEHSPVKEIDAHPGDGHTYGRPEQGQRMPEGIQSHSRGKLSNPARCRTIRIQRPGSEQAQSQP